jgi:hypothetical protein
MDTVVSRETRDCGENGYRMQASPAWVIQDPYSFRIRIGQIELLLLLLTDSELFYSLEAFVVVKLLVILLFIG